METKAKGKIITFYSYKGGTGRTMALANIACLLARAQSKKEKGILMIDWDLEAPGLHLFFQDLALTPSPNKGSKKKPESYQQKPGLIDYFEKIKLTLNKSIKEEQEQEEEEATQLIKSIPLKKYILETGIPNLHLLKAGRFDKKYAQRVNTFNWEKIYNQSPWLFSAFVSELSEKYRYILIDSRTGITDTSGICTMLMPEKLVVVFTPNLQSMTGIRDLTERATEYRRQSEDLRPLVVFPLPSRIDMSKESFHQDWRYGNKKEKITGYQPQFEKMFTKVYQLSECALEEYFNEIQLQYVADYAYGEKIAVLKNGKSRLDLSQSYEIFSDRLNKGAPPWSPQSEI